MKSFLQIFVYLAYTNRRAASQFLLALLRILSRTLFMSKMVAFLFGKGNFIDGYQSALQKYLEENH